jgi:hypothetical protein
MARGGWLRLQFLQRHFASANSSPPKVTNVHVIGVSVSFAVAGYTLTSPIPPTSVSTAAKFC